MPHSEFFAAHDGDGFRAHEHTPIMEEFSRLGHKHGWNKFWWDIEWRKCLVSELKLRMSSVTADEISKKEALQNMCKMLEVRVDEHDGEKECKKRLRGVYINIIDWIEAERAGHQVFVELPIFRVLMHSVHRGPPPKKE